MSADLTTTSDEANARIVECLGALAACAGNAKKAVKQLAERGVTISSGELDVMREQHTAVYMTLADDQKRAVEEAIAQTYREITIGAQQVTKKFVEQLAEDMEKGARPKDIDRSIQAMAKVMQVSTDKLLSITGRPVSGGAGDPMEALRELEKLGVATVHAPIDSTAVEE